MRDGAGFGSTVVKGVAARGVAGANSDSDQFVRCKVVELV